MTPCSLIGGYDVSEKHTTGLFKVDVSYVPHCRHHILQDNALYSLRTNVPQGLLVACNMKVAEERKVNSCFAFSMRGAGGYLQQAEKHRGNCQGLKVSVHSEGTFLGRG
jgi:hypothetical protein